MKSAAASQKAMLQETVTSAVPLLEVQGLVPPAIKAVERSEALPFPLGMEEGMFQLQGN